MSQMSASSHDVPGDRPPAPTPRDVLKRTHPTVLGQLFELGCGDVFHWTTAERGGLLSHQLDLLLGPAPGSEADAAESDAARGPDGWETRTYRALFTAADPPLDRLQSIKSRAKYGINADPSDQEGPDADGVLPREVATVVYYAALAAARVHAGVSITQLDDTAFRTGLHWALGHTWVDEPVRGLLTKALEATTPTDPKG